MDLALNNPQRLICRKTQQTKPNLDIHGVYCTFIFTFFFCSGISSVGLVWFGFNGKSTFMGYLKPNHLFLF